MKTGGCLWIVLLSLAACNQAGNAVSVKTDSLSKELDTLGNTIEKKAEVVGDSVKAKLNDIKITVNAQVDSISRAHHDTTQ
jgi:hypothetical protein